MSRKDETSLLKALPGMRAFFVRTRRQVYCDTPCTNAASKRTWLRRQALEKKVQELLGKGIRTKKAILGKFAAVNDEDRDWLHSRIEELLQEKKGGGRASKR